ncbi:hypothetical protein AN936_23230 (plasmid) [Sphingopyxis macrogoltabida]|uniref:Uncharacterized protein n=1 Tax=Sphingopyxis macrogoltabida TaxID=33050 RepID=A0A0N9V598_SPHMC|nr:hypothetical protein AN936_23230 [Sphingopyxis macrogoltabida]
MAGHGKRELIPDPLRQISKPPAHNAMGSRDRPSLDLLRQPGALLIIQDRSSPRCLACCQAIRTALVEPQHPVAHDLQGDTGKPGCIAPPSAVNDQRQRQ